MMGPRHVSANAKNATATPSARSVAFRIQTSNDEYVCIQTVFSHSASGRRQQLFSILAKVRSFPRHNFLR